MKKIILFIIFSLITHSLYSQERRVKKRKKVKKKTEYFMGAGYSFLTHHWYNTGAERFANKISDDGKTIGNSLVSFEYIRQKHKNKDDKYQKLVVFGGEDSIGTAMGGFYYSHGATKYTMNGFNVGTLIGMYFFDQDKWTERYHDTSNNSPSFLHEMGVHNVNIIIGLEINYHIKIDDQMFFKINNVITPMITNHGVGIGWRY